MSFYLTDDDICETINLDLYFSEINTLDLGVMNASKMSDISNSIKQKFNEELMEAHERGISLVRLIDILTEHYIDSKIVRGILNEDIKVILAIEIDYEYVEKYDEFLSNYF